MLLKTRKDVGMFLPTTDRTDIANAMSVADGMAHPFKATGSDMLNAEYIITGNITPPHADIIGNNLCFASERWPTINSRFISMPTNKKKDRH